MTHNYIPVFQRAPIELTIVIPHIGVHYFKERPVKCSINCKSHQFILINVKYYDIGIGLVELNICDFI